MFYSFYPKTFDDMMESDLLEMAFKSLADAVRNDIEVALEEGDVDSLKVLSKLLSYLKAEGCL